VAFHKREEAVGDSPLFHVVIKDQIEVAMTPNDRQYVIDKLQPIIDETQATIDRFESTGMNEQMPKDYDKLLAILDGAVKQQREHTMVMPDDPEPAPTCTVGPKTGL
jgi:hypothetical protein